MKAWAETERAEKVIEGFSFIKGDSMQPALKNGEVVMYLRMNIRKTK